MHTEVMAPTRFRIRIVVEPDGDEFHAYCPALNGLHTSGRTEEEAVENARDAAIAYIRSVIKHGDPIPLDCLPATPNQTEPLPSGTHTHYQIADLAAAAA